MNGWACLDELAPPLRKELFVDTSKSLINYYDSPDIPFDRSINPYRGCEHGCRGGKDYDSRFGMRMRGEGEYADLISRRFRLAKRRLGFPGIDASLDCDQFKVPGRAQQIDLFD